MTDLSELPVAGLFPPGLVLTTPGASSLGIDLVPFLTRHLSGDWGDVEEETRSENEDALRNEGELFSLYHTPAGLVMIVTAADRSSTTICIPEDD